MVPAGIRLDLADGTLVLLDEVRIHLAGPRTLYGSSMQHIVAPEHHLVLPLDRSAEIRIVNTQFNVKLWAWRDPTWVSVLTTGMVRIKYLHLTYLRDNETTLDRGPALVWGMAANMVPRYSGYFSVGTQATS